MFQSIPAENFPFCTIDPNESRVAVPDDRFDWLCDHFKPPSKVPAYLQVVDIAGLVKGASEVRNFKHKLIILMAGFVVLY